ncbi:hypothetical protein BGZ90_011376 [Linnemannia elongata]|nr:hypothetical protein BGZ90_011376 [Linnemannia elongata]
MMLLYLYPIVIYRELIWSLSVPILDQLESLTLPLSDVQRYHNVLHRLRNLKRIHFVKDLNMGCRKCGYGRLTDIQTSTTKEANDSIARFFEDYALLFPDHRLEGTTCSIPGYHGHDRHNGKLNPPLRDLVDKEILRALPPPNRLRVISPTKWTWISHHLHRTDMTRVRLIDWLPAFPDDPGWVAKSKRFKPQRLLRCDASEPGDGQDDESFHPDYFTHGLVPLAKVHLKRCFMPSPDLDALIYAFSQSLESLMISDLRVPHTLQMIHLGRDWVNLPLLRHLEVHVSFPCLVLDQLFFTRFPSLRTLKLLDNSTSKYSCKDIVPCYAADLSQVETLILGGWSALAFHPATLESTKVLKVLILTNNWHRNLCFIPPVNELYRSYGLEYTEDNIDDGANEPLSARLAPSIIRAHWTWDWHLPCLTHLSLTSEFAYRFEFKMLRGCPALEKLYLHIFTFDDTPHYRIISENDLFISAPGRSLVMHEFQRVAPIPGRNVSEARAPDRPRMSDNL